MNRLAVLLLLAAASAAQSPSSLQVLPAAVQLDGPRDQQRLLVLQTGPDGVAADVTARAGLRVEGDAAALAPGGDARLVPVHDGEAAVLVTVAGQQVRTPVRVTGTAAAPPWSFANDVLPVLTRAGCNAGSCHGAAAGKNGFALSLFAYDPPRDHAVLTRQLRGRRIDPTNPAQSLVLQKAGGLVAHGGGTRLPPDGSGFATVRDWIAAGAADDTATAPALIGLDVLPGRVVLAAGSSMQLVLRARYQDGSDRDVGGLALWSSGNDGCAAVDGDGRVRAVASGTASVLARYGGLAVATAVLVPFAGGPTVTVPATASPIDAEVLATLAQLRVAPTGRCSDAVFVRRLFLDLLGALPTPAETTAFVADPRPDKRARLVADLLQRPAFADLQAMAWAEVLRVDAERMEPKGAALLTRWLREQFAAQRPLDAVVRELLLASGPTFATPPANFWLAADQPQLLGEHVAQAFLGVRVQCAQCHNHPFENWTMDDYYGFASFFAQLGRKRGEDGAEWILWDRGSGEVRNKRNDRVVPPRYLGGGKAELAAGLDRRRALADWLVQSPQFARHVANRLWARLLGRGLVEPADDVRVSNPPSHPALLQALADQLVAAHFDVKPLVTAIVLSDTYQRDAAAAPLPPSLFAAMLVRRLPAEALLDAIAAVTAVPNRYPGVPAGGSAATIASGRTPLRFLELFGRPARDSSCVCERQTEPTLAQTLHLIAGDTIAPKLGAAQGRLQRALQQKQAPEAMLDELCLCAYSRGATAAEHDLLLAPVRAAQDDAARLTAWQDVYWAVLNSQEFLFQH